MEDVTYQQYQDAVIQLCELAQRDTSGSRAAAQVILSAYNGYRWQVDITELCYLFSNWHPIIAKFLTRPTKVFVNIFQMCEFSIYELTKSNTAIIIKSKSAWQNKTTSGISGGFYYRI